jgi:hypothetical protein
MLTPPYRDLGGFPITAIADPDGRNPFGAGLATCVINADTTFRSAIPLAEIYHVWVNSSPGAAFQVWRNQLQWDNVLVGNNAWDPSNPMPLRSGDSVFFYFNRPVTVMPLPRIVVWLREPYGFAS